MTTKDISVKLGERVAAMKILQDFKGDNLTLSFVLEDIKKIAISKEEWEKANLRKTPTDEAVAAMSPEERKNASQTWNWDDTAETTISIAQATADYIAGVIKTKSDAKELTIADASLLSLEKKVK